MTTLYHFWSSHEARRVWLALHCKGVSFDDRPLSYDDDDTFFELGVARAVPLLELDEGTRLGDAWDILWRVDELFPQAPALRAEIVDADAWQALRTWRERAEPILARLYAPLAPAYHDVAGHETTLAAYKAEVERRFGMGVEALANDRYAGYEQLARLSRLPELARHLARNGYYLGTLSIADLVLTADLHPLQLLDGVSLPIELMYYFKRVERACGADLGAGLASRGG
ncbi:glutathione S-transferase family protein [Ectothiorhodospiraceae bacterium 2226]|nr:glutathione S-transferase family protein [Ectothiorhodospiraceae bacterium 2226]